jgi:hypothetical protein
MLGGHRLSLLLRRGQGTNQKYFPNANANIYITAGTTGEL